MTILLLLPLTLLLASEQVPQTTIANHPRVIESERLLQAGRAEISAGHSDLARELFDSALQKLLSTPLDEPNRDAIDRQIQSLAEQIYLLDLESLGSARELDQVIYDKSPLDEIRELTFPVDPRLKSKVQQEVQSTTSQLPLAVNDTVLSFINYFNSGRGRKTLEYALKRSGRYKPMISRILAEEGVPQELIFLAQAESGFQPRAVSYKAAVGMWQFIKATGSSYGLTQTPFTDDRIDPERSTRAAAKHLRDLYEEFGDWHLALAAYNCGPGCVDRAVQRTGFADYWELRNRKAVPIETTNYVPIILALTIMMKNPESYGLSNLELEPPLEYDTIEVYSNTSLQLAADAAQIPVTQMQDLNPAILRNVAPRGYFLRIPKGSSDSVLAALNLVPADKRESYRLHALQPGDKLETLAAQYRSTLATLEQANPKFGEASFAAIPQSMPRPRPTPVAKTRIAARAPKATPIKRSAIQKTSVKRTPIASPRTKPTPIAKKTPRPTAIPKKK